MNHYYRFGLLGWLLLLTNQIWAQTPSINYIISRTYKQAGISEDFSAATFSANSNQAASQVTYVDGLGKPIQTIMAFGGGNKGDVVSLTEYDNLQRPFKTFLPVSFTTSGVSDAGSTTNKGLFRQPGDIKTKAGVYYKSASAVSAAISGDAPEEALAAQTVYESSPLSRLTFQKSPGAANSVGQVHGINSDGQVQYYQTTGPDLFQVQQTGSYAAGSLTWVQTTDENGSVVTEFQDRNGRTVLKQVKASDDTFLNTYYVYDEKGQLRAVIQPKYNSFGESDLSKNAFLYTYDDLGRLTGKKVPGANTVQMTYKGTTELIESSTDGKGQKFYYRYDNLNRQVEMGICTGGCDAQNYNDGANKVALQKNYYDTYPGNLTSGLSFSNELGIDGTRFHSDGDLLSIRTGLLTGTETRVLLPNGVISTSDPMLRSVIYYDNKYRVIQTVRQLYGFNNGAYERVSYRLAFDGKPEVEWTTQVTGSIAYKLTKSYSYDHANRLTKTDHVLFENDVQKKAYTHVEQLYNEMAQLAAKSLHGGRQILTYKYTPRGWLGDHQTSNGQPFSLGLNYQDNGNITSQSWTTKSYSGGMNLSYDKANRLTGATGTGNFANYDESAIQYDANGNIINLTRKYNNTTIDQLSYQYHGNQLHRVDDNNNNEGQAVKGFINNANADDEMRYDGNGNLTSDDNRNISSIDYNVLNLSRSLTRNSRTVQYTYDAAGTKLKSEAPDNVNTLYAGAFEYRADNTLLRIGLEEGQLVKDGSNYVAQYYLRDHLGNVRSVMDENGNVIQETEYYTFGLPIQRTGSDKNKYLYNGKEKQPETEWLDYGARMYDATIGRWIMVDPFAAINHDQSPFQYVLNNPMRYIDPFGLWEVTSTGYSTKDKEDIRRYTSYLRFEKQGLGNDPSISQIRGFISSEMSGGLGTLSNGGKLVSEISEKAYQIGGRFQWQVDRGSVSNAWHDVQGDLTPDELDPRTVGQQYFFGLTYPGGDNPRSYNGKYDYSYVPHDLSEYPAIGHDRRYDKLGITGASGLFKDSRAIGADWKFVIEELSLAASPLPGNMRLHAFTLGLGLGMASLPKTASTLMTPNGFFQIMLWYHVSNQDVKNTPSKP